MESLFANLNWLHILVAAIAYFALGAIWYSFLFQKQWVRYQGINMEDPEMKKGAAGIMLLSFLAFFVICIGLAVLVERLGLIGGWMSGVKLGLFTGVCFSAMAVSINFLYTKRPFGLHLIDGAYHVVGQIIAAIILCVWD